MFRKSAENEKGKWEMIEFAWKMYKRYEETVNYLFFGVLAFLVNMLAYALAVWVLHADNEKMLLISISTAFAWVVAVLFAYWTNRTFVFKSKVTDKIGIWKEFSAFVGARVVTGVLEQVIMYVMVNLLGIHNMIAKFVCNIVVIVSNYIFSKLFIFKKKQ